MSEEEAKDYRESIDVDLIFGIDLRNGVVLRKFLMEDFGKAHWKTITSLLPSLSLAEFTLEKRVRDENGLEFQRLRPHIHKALGKTVLALRLLKPGYIAGNFIFDVAVRLAERNQLISWTIEAKQRTHSHGPSYALQSSEIPELANLLKKIQNIDIEKHKSLRIACKRFQQSYEENNPEDKIIDLIIGLKALFSDGPGIIQRGETLSNDCAHLLGDNETDEYEIKHVMNDAILLRDSIICNSPYEKSEDPDYMLDLVSRVEDYLRESLKHFINLYN
jgi:hypothetical protein